MSLENWALSVAYCLFFFGSKIFDLRKNQKSSFVQSQINHYSVFVNRCSLFKIAANYTHFQAVSGCHFDQREKSPSRLVHIKRSFPAPPSLERTGVMISVFYPAILPLQGEISRCSVYGALPRAVAIFDLRPITDCRLKNEIFINFLSVRKKKPERL